MGMHDLLDHLNIDCWLGEFGLPSSTSTDIKAAYTSDTFVTKNIVS